MGKLKYITVSEAAKREGVSVRRIQALIKNKQITGCEKLGTQWAVPENYVIMRGESGPDFQKIKPPKPAAKAKAALRKKSK
jgi:excisionase family DNA binding protein